MKGIVLKDDRQHVLVIDGGMAKFRFVWNGENVEVLDLSARPPMMISDRRFLFSDD